MTQQHPDNNISVDEFFSQATAGPGCWEWQGERNGRGFALARVGSRQKYAYRVAFELGHGSIPDGMHIHHKCGNTACVRPSHLEAVTPIEHGMRHKADLRPEDIDDLTAALGPLAEIVGAEQ